MALRNLIQTYLNDLGIVNSIGTGKTQVLKCLLGNDAKKLIKYSHLYSGKSTYVGRVSTALESIKDYYPKFNSKNNQLIATAYQQIKLEVENLKQKFGANRIGIILGTSTSGIASAEQAWIKHKQNKKFPKDFHYEQQDIASGSAFLARYTGITGLNYTISTACSSSGKAIAAAQRLIQTGICDAVITGGSDALCEMTLNGFDALELISEQYNNPFSKNRSGLNIGEGACLFILSKEPSEIKLTGTGESSDGFHISSPDPEGAGGILAIQQALSAAQLSITDIGYINLHGTATLKNDAAESKMIHKHFPNQPYCSSTKPLTGHTLGAASAHELAFCWLLLSQQYNPTKTLPAQIWDNQPDPKLPKINLLTTPEKWVKNAFMSNSFAFGGSNVSLIIEQA